MGYHALVIRDGDMALIEPPVINCRSWHPTEDPDLEGDDEELEIELDLHARGYIAKLTPRDIDAYIAAKRRSGLSVKTISNHLNFAHGVFAFALKRGWVTINAVAMTDRPPSPPVDPDIRFLDRDELEALLRAAADDLLGPRDRVLWITAAMTGLRQGELAALRWRDVDWSAGLIRVRRSYSRGQYTTPKSRRSSRAVPMADRVAGELERHFQRSATPTTTSLSSAIPTRAGRTTQARAACGSSRRSSAPACGAFVSTTCDTRTER